MSRVHPQRVKKFLRIAGLFLLAITPFVMFFLLLPEESSDEPTLKGPPQLAFPYTAAEIQFPPTDFLPEATDPVAEASPEAATNRTAARRTSATKPTAPPKPSAPPATPAPAVQITQEEEVIDDPPAEEPVLDVGNSRPSGPPQGPPSEDPTGLGDNPVEDPDTGNQPGNNTGNDQSNQAAPSGTTNTANNPE